MQDLTSHIKAFTATLSRPSGTVTVTSQHTTTGVAINENEKRLVEDMRLWLSRIAPPSDMYLHNDLDQREAPGAPAPPPSHLISVIDSVACDPAVPSIGSAC